MWCRTCVCLCKNSYLAEVALKLSQSSGDFVVPSTAAAKRWLSSSSDGYQNLQKVLNIKYNSEGRRRIEIQPSPFAISSQSVILPGPERIRACGIISTPEKLLEFPDEDSRSVCDVLVKGQLKTHSGRCLGYRSPTKHSEYEWISYEEVAERVNCIGSGLVNLGFEPSQQTFVGICSKTRPEFLMTLLGVSQFSMVLVPLYECSGPEAISYILNQVKLKVIICEDLKLASMVIQNRNNYPDLQCLILIDDTEEIEELEISPIKVIPFKELENLGRLKKQKPKKPNPNDVFCICFTSGTTGQPKGVMITHRNVLSTMASMNFMLEDAVNKQGILYAYLPSAHIYEIVNETFTLYQGGQIGFYSGSTDDLLSDIANLKPTVLPLVPKLMNRIYSGVKTKIGPNFLKRYFFKLALRQKEEQLKRGIISKESFWDYLLFSQVQKLMGGCVELIITASAPISKEVIKFFRCASGCLVLEAYGLSEVGAATMTLLSEHNGGFVGPPLPSNHIKLISAPELSYDAADDVGEICIRGPNVFLCYYKNEEDTKKALDSEGWHHTGDIGKWLPNGTLCIIDRKKHIFKLSQGEYIVPEKSENIYVQSHIISQVFFDGEMEQDFAVAIVVPDEPAFMKWVQEKGFKNKNYEDVCKNKNVRVTLLEHMLKTGRRKNLSSLQQAGNVYISTEPFTQENGLLTPTLKLKRPEARKLFKNAIQQLYDEGNMRKMHNM